MASTASIPTPAKTGDPNWDKLVDQFLALQAAIDEATRLNAGYNSFTARMLKMAQDRITKAEAKPLQKAQFDALSFQLELNEKARKLQGRGAAAGEYGTIVVPDPAAGSGTMITQFVRGEVDGGEVAFDPASGLGSSPNSDLPDGQYIFEIKQDGDYPAVVRARRAAELALTFPWGEGGQVHIPPMHLGEGASAVRVPVVDPGFYIQPRIEHFVEMVYSLAEERPQKVKVTGPPGAGKTTIPQQMAARTQRPFFQIACGLITSPDEWFGQRTVADGKIDYVESAFIQAVETPNCDIILDEYNRIHSALQNPLFNLLDDNGETYLEYANRVVRVAAGVVFWGTMNLGAGHTGTFIVDSAMDDRFSYELVVDFLPANDEVRVLVNKTGIEKQVAEELVRIANRAREMAKNEETVLFGRPMGFRVLEAAARLITRGIRPFEAMQYTALPKYSADGGDASQQAQVLQIIQGVLGKKA